MPLANALYNYDGKPTWIWPHGQLLPSDLTTSADGGHRGSLAEMPAGFEFAESINGVVSIRRVDNSPNLVAGDDVELVRRSILRLVVQVYTDAAWPLADPFIEVRSSFKGGTDRTPRSRARSDRDLELKKVCGPRFRPCVSSCADL
jgi:hypothetical protein